MIQSYGYRLKDSHVPRVEDVFDIGVGKNDMKVG